VWVDGGLGRNVKATLDRNIVDALFGVGKCKIVTQTKSNVLLHLGISIEVKQKWDSEKGAKAN